MTDRKKKPTPNKKTFITHLFMYLNQDLAVKELLWRVDTIQRCGKEAVVEIHPDSESRVMLSARSKR